MNLIMFILECIYNQIITYAENEEDTLLLIDDFASELKKWWCIKIT